MRRGRLLRVLRALADHNWSNCAKARFWLWPVPADNVTLVRGADTLSVDTFGPKTIADAFCRQGGLRPHGTGAAEALGGRFVAFHGATRDMARPAWADFEVAFLKGREDAFEDALAVPSSL